MRAPNGISALLFTPESLLSSGTRRLYDDQADNRVTRPDSPLVRLVLISNTLAAMGALCGIVALLRWRNRHAFPLAGVVLVYPVIYYVTHASLRYRHPIDPVVLLLSAVAVAALVQKGQVRVEAVPPPA